MEKVLITGICGGQGKVLAHRLLDSYEVCGVDVRPWQGQPSGIRIHDVDVRKRKFEDVLRKERPSAVVHMGFIRHFRGDPEARHDVNVRGTKLLLDHCVNHDVKSVVVMSSSYVYGAFPENPYLIEEDAPLSASRSYPEVRDLVEVDTLATAFIWKYPDIQTCVLRPVSILGPTVESMASEYLRQRRVPTVMGFDPMFQVIHEEDVAEAFVLALEHKLRGVYNVVGPGEVPLHTIIEETGGRLAALPSFLLRGGFNLLFKLGLGAYPAGALDYMMYPFTLSGERFREATGFQCQFGLREIFESVRR